MPASIAQLAAQLESVVDRWSQLVSPDETYRATVNALLQALSTAVLGFDDRFLEMMKRIDAASPGTASAVSTDDLRALIAPLVADAVSATFGKLEAAVQAQPEVANTGSGAAPEAPVAQPASDGAAQPPVAAGTAPL